MTNLRKLTTCCLFAETFLSTRRETVVNLGQYGLPAISRFSRGLKCQEVSTLMLVSGECLRLED